MLGRCFCLLVLVSLSVFAKSRREYSIQSSFAELEGLYMRDVMSPQNLEDQLFFSRLERTYDQYRDLQFQDIDETQPPKIPHILHVIWVGTEHFPADSVENMRTWVAENPGWTFKFGQIVHVLLLVEDLRFV